MAKITPMWLNDAMRGRADKTSRTYTKVDRITGRTYAVTLRNPISGKNFTDPQITQNNKFGALSMGVNAWCEMAKASDASAADKAQYAKFQKMVKSQHVYPTVRALIIAKRYATVAADYSSVTIADGAYTKTVEFVFNARPLAGMDGGSSGSGSGSSTGNVTLTVSAGENGKVKIGDGTAAASANTTVAAGTSVQITAVPNSGYVFQMWSDGNTNATRSVTVNSNTVLNASFAASGEGGGNGDGFGDGD